MLWYRYLITPYYFRYYFRVYHYAIICKSPIKTNYLQWSNKDFITYCHRSKACF